MSLSFGRATNINHVLVTALKPDAGVEKCGLNLIPRFFTQCSVVWHCQLIAASRSSCVPYLFSYSVFALILKEIQYREHLENCVFIRFCKGLCEFIISRDRSAR